MRRESWLAFGLLILILAAMAAKSMLVSPPEVDSTPGHFDSNRAKARLAFILGNQVPHPADSAADDEVRARLVATLQQMGLKPIVRDQQVCNDFQKSRLIACARVRNVIATLGPSNGKALLLSAHYDSVAAGPGASDDGIGVATLLEVGSHLKDRPLKRPVILLFNEGEELGLVGARAFLADPLSRNVDSVLNFEARGATGPVVMFETSQPNGAAIAAFGSAVGRPVASSMMTDVARLIPNDSDVTTYKKRGWLTLNFAKTGNETRYHSPGDDLAAFDLRSLQHMGDQALAVASELSAGVPRPSGQRIFFDVLGRGFIQMPLIAGIILLMLQLGLFAAVARKRDVLIGGTATVFGAIIVAVALAWLAITAMAALRAGTYWRAYPEITFVAIYATALLGEIAVLRTVAAKIEARRMRSAFWFAFLLLGGALALFAPGGIIYFLLPPAALLIGIAASRWYPRAEAIGAVVGIVLLYLTWGEMLALLEEIFSPGPLWTVAPAGAILMMPALIEAHRLFDSVARRTAIIGSAAIALASWAVVGAAPAYSADREQEFTIEHVTEVPSHRSYWSVQNDGAPLPEAYGRGIEWRWGKLPFSGATRWFSPAPAIPSMTPPSVEVIEAIRDATERRTTIGLKTNGAENILLIAPPEARILGAGVAGSIRPMGDVDADDKYTITCTGRSCDGFELTIDQNRAAPTTFTVIAARNGLPGTAAALVNERPPFARPQYIPDRTVTISRVNL